MLQRFAGLIEQPCGVGAGILGLLQNQRQDEASGGRADSAAEQLFGKMDGRHVGGIRI
ncbi:hypothetical protein D3C72_2432370 [compost metagenome]